MSPLNTITTNSSNGNSKDGIVVTGGESVAVICANLRKCMAMRERYMAASRQLSNPKDRWSLEEIEKTGKSPDVAQTPARSQMHSSYLMHPDGIFRVVESDAKDDAQGAPDIPSIEQYYADVESVSWLCSDGPTKTWAFRRLRLLSAHFQMHLLQHEQAERHAQKSVPHRDFYNVRKIDNHVHHSSCMNCKHLLRFIKGKLKTCANDVVIFRDERELTLQQVFDSLKLTAYDLSIDSLDTHAHKDSFHRFDHFNTKYDPLGETRLREIFLKTDNLIGGRYLAELTKEVFDDLANSKYQLAEYHLSVYGRNPNEWSKLADWVVTNGLYSDNVRWIIQVPRLYHIYRAAGSLENFEQFLSNIFEPLFKVTMDPQADPKLHHFLKRVAGFDSVDDESKRERRAYKHIPSPREWTSRHNPPYSYYLYYMFANIAMLNKFRESRSFNTFTLRPHCGEAGDPDHLISAYLTSQGICHGILLRKLPVIQYLYYLSKIPIAMSPLSNNALFLSFDRNPFPDYFQRGLQVTLSTDDPLQFHYTREPLMEEYSVAAQIWKLSSCDMCEIARNSILGSGWEAGLKERWIGNWMPGDGKSPVDSDLESTAASPHSSWSKTPSVASSLTFNNDIAKTNVPDIRMHYRQQRHLYEVALVYSPSGTSPPPQLLHMHLFSSSPQLSLTIGGESTVERLSGENLLLKEAEELDLADESSNPDHYQPFLSTSPAPSDQ